MYNTPTKLLPARLRIREGIGAGRGFDPVWDYGENECIQGVVGLTKHFRCEDAWWNEVLDQIRTLQLSDDNHVFFTGCPQTCRGRGPTAVPCVVAVNALPRRRNERPRALLGVGVVAWNAKSASGSAKVETAN